MFFDGNWVCWEMCKQLYLHRRWLNCLHECRNRKIKPRALFNKHTKLYKLSHCWEAHGIEENISQGTYADLNWECNDKQERDKLKCYPIQLGWAAALQKRQLRQMLLFSPPKITGFRKRHWVTAQNVVQSSGLFQEAGRELEEELPLMTGCLS